MQASPTLLQLSMTCCALHLLGEGPAPPAVCWIAAPLLQRWLASQGSTCTAQTQCPGLKATRRRAAAAAASAWAPSRQTQVGAPARTRLPLGWGGAAAAARVAGEGVLLPPASLRPVWCATGRCTGPLACATQALPALDEHACGRTCRAALAAGARQSGRRHAIERQQSLRRAGQLACDLGPDRGGGAAAQPAAAARACPPPAQLVHPRPRALACFSRALSQRLLDSALSLPGCAAAKMWDDKVAAANKAWEGQVKAVTDSAEAALDAGISKVSAVVRRCAGRPWQWRACRAPLGSSCSPAATAWLRAAGAGALRRPAVAQQRRCCAALRLAAAGWPR